MRTLNQATLRELEALCTQEQAPAAMAACPLHVDCRAICAAVTCGDYDAALALYIKNVPFPGIVSTLCSSPCESGCIRKELGGSIAMRQLEKSIVCYGNKKKKKGFIPRRQDWVAIVGGGICGLTAAVDLARKGCKVVIFEQRAELGGRLLEADILAKEVLEQDLEILNEYPIEVQLQTVAPDTGILLQEYGAVFLAVGEQEYTITIQPDTYETAEPRIFAGGDMTGRKEHSLIHAMADGKRASISIDRCLKGVSLEAGRELEGVYRTSLYVETRETEVAVGKYGMCPERCFTKAEAMAEASRCLDCKCLECVKGCAFLSHFKSYPRKYVREVYNNLSIAMGIRHANKMINACSICGQCKAICPNGLDLGTVIADARKIMVESHKMPQSAFEFAILDMQQSNGEDCMLMRHQKGYVESTYAFFPGCQLSASAPEIVEKAYMDLTTRLAGGVGIILGCCGIVADWAGQEQLYKETVEQLQASWAALGNPKLIVACPTCYKTLEHELGAGSCLGIWDILESIGLPPQASNQQGQLVVKDACGAREYKKVQESVRNLLSTMGYELQEDKFSKEHGGCCGFGGLASYSNPQVAQEAAQLAVPHKDWNYVTYCMNCRDRYTKEGAQAVHILELLYDEDKGAAHKIPTYSSRQDNRIKLKERLEHSIWGEETNGEARMILEYSREMQGVLEERMILDSDIRQVITHMETERGRIRHMPTGLYIGNKKVKNVTFWVWYRPLAEGYYIENAYSHRMEIKGEVQHG